MLKSCLCCPGQSLTVLWLDNWRALYFWWLAQLSLFPKKTTTGATREDATALIHKCATLIHIWKLISSTQREAI